MAIREKLSNHIVTQFRFRHVFHYAQLVLSALSHAKLGRHNQASVHVQTSGGLTQNDPWFKVFRT